MVEASQLEGFRADTTGVERPREWRITRFFRDRYIE